MHLTNWLSNLQQFRRSCSTRTRGRRSAGRTHAQSCLQPVVPRDVEILEDRTLLAVVLFEDFEDATVAYATNVADDLSDIANEDYFGRIDSGVTIPIDIVYTNAQGAGYYGAQDTDSANSGNVDIVTLDWTGINISGFTALNLSWYVAEDDDGINEDWDITTSVRLTAQIDGG